MRTAAGITAALLSAWVHGLDAQAPALNAPPALPLDSAAYGPSGLRFAVLLQVRADFPETEGRNSTFFLRKAELGIRGHVTGHTDFSVELDPVNPDDPFRRTYLRLSHFPRLHVKVGMEKAPLGLEELLSTATVPFVDRSQVNDRFAAAEEVGVHLESRWDRWLFQMSITNGGRRLLRDDNDHKDLTLRAVWAPSAWASVGVAALSGRAGEEARKRKRYNVEVKLGSTDSGAHGELYEATDGDVQSSAFHVSLFRAFSVSQEWLDSVQPAIRYERVDREDELEQEELSLLTFGLGFLVDGHRSKLVVNYVLDLRSAIEENELRVQYQVEF